MKTTEFYAGVARKDITPRTPIWMSGYPFRARPSEGMVHPLWAKALAIQDRRQNRVVIVATDLIGLPREITDLVLARLTREYGIQRSQIMFNSTHTHSGPVIWPNLRTMFNLSPEDEKVAIDYSRRLADDLFFVISEALADLAPAHLSCGFGSAHFAVNRRQRTAEGVRIGVNPSGSTDSDVPVLRVVSEGGETRAVVFGYACHNTASSPRTYQLSGDYAGSAQIELEKLYPGAAAMFLTLCGGDQNPNPHGSTELAERHGRALAAEVSRVLLGALCPVQSPLRTAFANVQLKFEPRTRETFERELTNADPARARRAAAMLRAFDEGAPLHQIAYPMQVLRFGSDFTILALGGEVVVSYGLRIKSEYSGKFFVAAYSNDVMSYIPSRNMLREGGYEPIDSMKFYGLPGPYTVDVEEHIFQGLARLMKRVGIMPRCRGAKSAGLAAKVPANSFRL